MAEQNNVSPEQVAQALMQAMGQVNGMMGGQAAPAVQAGNTMLPAMPAPQNKTKNGMEITGWSVPVETEINGMTVTVYVQFPAQTFPQFQQIIAAMMEMGYQVRGFRNGGGYGGNGASYGRGGYGGGYNRGGGYGRKW